MQITNYIPMKRIKFLNSGGISSGEKANVSSLFTKLHLTKLLCEKSFLLSEKTKHQCFKQEVIKVTALLRSFISLLLILILLESSFSFFFFFFFPLVLEILSQFSFMIFKLSGIWTCQSSLHEAPWRRSTFVGKLWQMHPGQTVTLCKWQRLENVHH